MAYTAWSVVFGEQPTAAKWNQLGANDAGFRDGTNIDTGVIGALHLAAQSVTESKLSTSAINLGYAQITADLSSISSATFVDLTGLSVTITAPTARKIRIEGFVKYQQSAVGSTLGLRSMEGATQIQLTYDNAAGTSITDKGVFIAVEFTASAGSHTYKLQGNNAFASGDVTVKGASTAPSYISVKAI